jgi:Uma2 family endonuclease
MKPHTIIPEPEEIEYPDSDGQPMSDNTLQFQWIVLVKENLEVLYQDREDVFVAGDLLWYPVLGHPEIRSAPDALVAIGRPKGYRGSYKQWEEGGQPPQVVWEITSPGNRRADLDAKWEFYQSYGVQEYYLYDPDRVRLRGWLRQGETLQEIEGIERGWVSPLTGVRMEVSGGDLHLYHPDGKPFRTLTQESQQREAAETRAEQERREREAAQARAEQERREREAAEARAEQERRQREAAESKNLQERQEREAAQAQAEQERRQREAAQARAEQLADRLRELGIDPDA